MRRKHALRFLLRRGRTYYFKKRIGPQVLQLSLKTEDLELAKARRDAKLRELNDADLAELRGATRPATIGEVLAAYTAGIAAVARRKIEPQTIRTNAHGLRNLVKWGDGHDLSDPAVDARPVTTLTEELAARTRLAYLAPAGDDRLALESRRRGLAGLFRHARSVFSARARTLYRRLCLPQRGLDAFLAAARIEAAAREHRPISVDVLQRMDAEMAALRAAQPALWLVHALHKFAGLRNEEIVMARVDWFARAAWGQVFLAVTRREDFEPKRSEGYVPLHSSVAASLGELLQGKAGTEFVIPAPTFTARQDLVYRAHAAWMRRFLPAAEYGRAGYELRRWAAQIMRARYGDDAGEAFLRHTPKSVAGRHYFERFFPWRRLGDDVGITWEDARGAGDTATGLLSAWTEGAAALTMPRLKAEG